MKVSENAAIFWFICMTRQFEQLLVTSNRFTSTFSTKCVRRCSSAKGMTKLCHVFKTVFISVSVHAACNPESCQFGGSCLATALDSTELECVCPSYPRCTPETGGNIVVCGDDGVTYSSFCEMRDALCAEQKWISLRHEGPCGMFLCEYLKLERKFSSYQFLAQCQQYETPL